MVGEHLFHLGGYGSPGFRVCGSRETSECANGGDSVGRVFCVGGFEPGHQVEYDCTVGARSQTSSARDPQSSIEGDLQRLEILHPRLLVRSSEELLGAVVSTLNGMK